jgi:SAM-dependent methyltransferase
MSQTRTADTWEHGEPYERYMGRWSRRVAAQFLAWLGIPSGRRWLDVGCGNGALCGAILDNCSPSSVIGVEPSQGFLAKAQEQLAGRVVLRQGTAAQVPLNDSTVDVTCSGLVLNFLPDPSAALVEMTRVTRDGGAIAAYLWDYAGNMELIRLFWETALELDPEAARRDEGVRFPMCNPGALTLLFENSGLRAVEVIAIDIPTLFPNFDDYWRPFLGGQGPAPAYAMVLDGALRQRLRDRLQQRLPVQADGSISLTARAWAVRGTVAKQGQQNFPGFGQG